MKHTTRTISQLTQRALKAAEEAPKAAGRVLSASEIMDRTLALCENTAPAASAPVVAREQRRVVRTPTTSAALSPA